MSRVSCLAPLMSLVLTCLLSFPAKATEVEASGAAPIVVTPTNATFYNTTGITIGSYLYVYHQGDDGVEGGGDPNCYNSGGDRIIAYRALITSGVPGTFQRVGRISPAVKAPTKSSFWPANCTPPAFYGPGQVFQATVNGLTKYHLLADVSDARIFKNVWRAESTDGVNWTWYISGAANANKTETLTRSDTGASYQLTSIWSAQPFFQTTSSVGLLNPILRSEAPATNNATWWGFFNFWDGVGKVGAMKVEWGTGSPVIKVVTSSSPSWTYSTLTGGNLTVVPSALIHDSNVKSLHQEGSQFQLWGSARLGTYGSNVSCNTNTSLQCTQPGGCKTGDGSAVAYLATARPFWMNTGPAGDVTCTAASCPSSGVAWWPVTSTTLGARNPIFSAVRSMPSGYGEARTFPFRWNSPTGNRYLFSATNDNNICTRFLFSPFQLMYVVRTTLVNQ